VLLAAGAEDDVAGDGDGVEVRARDREPAHLFVDRVQVEEAPSAAAVGLGEGDAEPSQAGHRLPDLRLVAGAVGLDVADGLGRAVPAEEVVRRALQELLVLVECQVDRHRPPLPRETQDAGGNDHALDL